MRYYTDEGITYLLTRDLWSVNARGFLPLDGLLLDLTLDCRTRRRIPDCGQAIINRIRHLLGVMKSEQPGRGELVSFRSVFTLSRKILGCLYIPISSAGDCEVYYEVIWFLGKVLEVLLSFGANLRSTTVATYDLSMNYLYFFRAIISGLANDRDHFDFKIQLHRGFRGALCWHGIPTFKIQERNPWGSGQQDRLDPTLLLHPSANPLLHHLGVLEETL